MTLPLFLLSLLGGPRVASALDEIAIASLTEAVPLHGAVGTRGMPVFGLGCHGLRPGEETETAVRSALGLGYRLFETAAADGNEESVGRALRASGVQRSEVFLVSQLLDSAHGYGDAHRGLRTSLNRLGVDYIDLVLQGPRKFIETWDALVELRMMGLARSVGVVGFELPHLEALSVHGRQLPAVNRVEVHPRNWQLRRPLVDWCRGRGIVVQASRALRRYPGSGGQLLTADAMRRLAGVAGRTPAQVLLRWGHQMGFVLAPRSRTLEQLRENAGIFGFTLDEAAMAELPLLFTAAPTTGPVADPAKSQLPQLPPQPASAELLDVGDTSHAGPGMRAAARRGTPLEL